MRKQRKSKILDRTGQTIGNWTFIKFVGLTEKQNAKWLCKCSCGNETIVLGYNIISGASKNCVKCMALKHIKSYEGTIPTTIWKTILRNSKNRNKEFNISKEYAYNLFISQNKKCILSGIDIKFALNHPDYVKGNQTASLDRIDSNKAYVKGNVQWVHKIVNMMKNKLNEVDFINYCKLIVDHHNKNTN